MLVVAVVLLCAGSVCWAQESTQAQTVDPVAVALLNRAARSANSGAPLKDYTLIGTAHRIFGESEETVPVTLQVLGNGSSRLELTLTNGKLTEMRDFGSSAPAGGWIGPDGVAHKFAYHNLVDEPLWMAPGLLVSQISQYSAGTKYQGAMQQGAESAEHVSVQSPVPIPTAVRRMSPKAGTFEVYLDSKTLLPTSVEFQTHPDRDALTDLLVEIRYSDYRLVSGQQVPFRVQKYFRGALILDLRFTSATANNGVTISDITKQ